MDRIVLATDGSEEARPAVAYALRLARQLGATLVVAHVIEPQAFAFEMAPEAVLEQLAESIRAEGRRVVSAVERVATEQAIPCESVLAEGNVASELLRIAAEKEARLLVCGRHGRGAFGRLLLGSVSTKLAHLSPVPLLIVPSSEPKPK